LLRLLLPLNDRVRIDSSMVQITRKQPGILAVLNPHHAVQSVGATGGVYKGQGRNQHELMTRAY